MLPRELDSGPVPLGADLQHLRAIGRGLFLPRRPAFRLADGGWELSGMRVLLWGIALMLMAPSAQAQIYHANDTGGIIPWSCENEAGAHRIAAAYCARWDKYHRITSVHRHYGDFIAFNCLWTPYVNRYALPAVHTRSACGYERLSPRVRALN